MAYRNSKRIDSEKMSAEIITLKDRILGYQERIKSLQGSVKSLEASKEKQKCSYESAIAQKDAVIKELKNKLVHKAAVSDHDGTNTGISTASTPINKKKLSQTQGGEAAKRKAGSRDTQSTSWKSSMHLKSRKVRRIDWAPLRYAALVAENLSIPKKPYQKMNLMSASRW